MIRIQSSVSIEIEFSLMCELMFNCSSPQNSAFDLEKLANHFDVHTEVNLLSVSGVIIKR